MDNLYQNHNQQNQSEDRSSHKEMTGLKAFLAGGAGGIAFVLANHPFDTLKVRLQTSSEYNGAIDCLRKSISRGGIRTLFRGIGSPLMGVTPIWALSFWSYEVSQNMILSLSNSFGFPYHSGYTKDLPRAKHDLTYAEFFLAGSLSAIPTTMLTTPIERLKVIMQTQNQSSSTNDSGGYKNIFEAARGEVQKGGWRSLYRGTTATIIRDMPGVAAYYTTYEYFSRRFADPMKDSSGISIKGVLIAGGMAGVTQWTISIPADVVKSRIQSAPPGLYTGFRDALYKLVRHEGPSVLFRGLGTVLTVSFPTNAVALLGRAVGLEILHRML